ncbi:MAG: hypothetical protein NTY14_02140 [Candidatus Omnitrophica bacterium]|nr:hypothetical protein [Candidatus Omnitrophota bacterium]
MEEGRFQEYLDSIVSRLKGEDPESVEKELKSLLPVLSFKKYEKLLSLLKEEKVLSAQQYEVLKKHYLVLNKYLMVYGISSRVFGEIWAIQQLKTLDKGFKEPNKTFDPSFCGQYDLLFDNIKIGTRACRAVDIQEEGGRFDKALHYDSGKPFEMNFRQLRIESCEVIVLIGVWIDRLVYWVLSYNEIKDNKYFFHDKGKAEESLLVISDKNISDFDGYRADEPQVMDVILKKKS